jgi:hypothetical protein
MLQGFDSFLAKGFYIPTQDKLTGKQSIACVPQLSLANGNMWLQLLNNCNI